MSGPIVRVGFEKDFSSNWDKIFGKKQVEQKQACSEQKQVCDKEVGLMKQVCDKDMASQKQVSDKMPSK